MLEFNAMEFVVFFHNLTIETTWNNFCNLVARYINKELWLFSTGKSDQVDVGFYTSCTQNPTAPNGDKVGPMW